MGPGFPTYKLLPFQPGSKIKPTKEKEECALMVDCCVRTSNAAAAAAVTSLRLEPLRVYEAPPPLKVEGYWARCADQGGADTHPNIHRMCRSWFLHPPKSLPAA